jgi:hypothetical protein
MKAWRLALLATAPLALAPAGGCSKLLGFSSPREQVDAAGGGAGDAPPSDAPVDAAVPLTLHVITGGTGSGGVITSVPAGIACPGTCDATFPLGASVALSAGSATTGTFTGFFGASCMGAQACTIATGGDVTVFGRYYGSTDNIAFVSSTQQAPGAFDTATAADTLCASLAAGAGLPTETYAAWLSTTTQSAVDRVVAGGRGMIIPSGFTRPDGKPFASSVPELSAGHILSPARLDELGRDVGDDAIAVTNTTAAGSAGDGDACHDLSSVSEDATLLAGSPAGGFGQWSSDATQVACGAPAHIYCIGNAHTSAFVPPPPLGQTLLFVSSAPFVASGGPSGADGQCAADAQAANLPNPTTKALVTQSGHAVSLRFAQFIFQSPPQRPDGIELAPSMAALFAGSAFEAAPDVAADGTFVDAPVWIGAGGFDGFVTDCDDWQTASSSAFGATRPAGTTRDSAFFQQLSCDSSAHVLCVNFFAAVLPQ